VASSRVLAAMRASDGSPRQRDAKLAWQRRYRRGVAERVRLGPVGSEVWVRAAVPGSGWVFLVCIVTTYLSVAAEIANTLCVNNVQLTLI
jgi:hypothetical protein